MIDVIPTLDEKELHWTFIQSSGPGGQNVNKVATAVQLQFDVVHSSALSETVKNRLIHLAGRRITRGGVLLIESKRYRTQEQNRQDAMNRLAILLRKAHEKPKTRRKTHPTLASHQRRLASKRRRSDIKRLRGEQVSRQDT